MFNISLRPLTVYPNLLIYPNLIRTIDYSKNRRIDVHAAILVSINIALFALNISTNILKEL